MKALRLKVTKDFMNKKVGDILSNHRKDLADDLIKQGLAEWVTVEVEKEFTEPIVGKPVVIEPEVKIYKPVKKVLPKGKPKPLENKKKK